MDINKLGLLTLITGAMLSMICPGIAYAGAAYIYEMGNPSDTGYAGAGLAARAGDAGTVFTNPAGMTRFKESTFQAGLTPLYLYGPFNPGQGTTVPGSDGDTNLLFAGANFAYIKPVSDNLRLGISMGNFFGLSLNWGDDWVGRYLATEVTLIAPQLQPTAAYKVNSWLSIGAGAALTVGYLKDKAQVKSQTLPASLEDGYKFSDTDFAVQGNFGIMIEPSENTRFGVRYLTETDLDFDDRVEIPGVGPDPRLDLGMKMPQTIMGGVYHRINDKWAILGSVGWDDWSRFGRVNVDIGIDDAGTTVDADFDDTWHFGVGAEYQYTPKLTLTAGFSYDSSMSKASTRPINLPLGEMYRYGVGFKYRKSDDVTLGAGFSFLWEGDLKIKPSGNEDKGFVTGQYDNVYLAFLSLFVQW
jgi:long-chain fatty acid transport protein